MKTNIESLVEEAYDKLNMVKIINRDQHEYCVAVLTTLAEEASQNGKHCSPYTEPTTLEKFMQSLTPEQLELAKRLKIEEGGE